MSLAEPLYAYRVCLAEARSGSARPGWAGVVVHLIRPGPEPWSIPNLSFEGSEISKFTTKSPSSRVGIPIVRFLMHMAVIKNTAEIAKFHQ